MIIICEYCLQYECPPSCPNFDGFVSGLGVSNGECSICEGRIYEEETYYERNGKILCQDCAEEFIPQELLEFLDCKSIKDFFDLLY